MSAAPSSSSRGLTIKQIRLIGISVEGLISDALKSSGGALKPDQFKTFWQLISQSDQKETTTYLVDVLSRTLLILEGKDKEVMKKSQGDSSAGLSSDSGGDLDAVGIPLESFLNTINFIVLNLIFNQVDPRVKQKIDQFAKAESIRDSATRQYPQAKEVFRLLQLRIDNVDMIGPLIIGCSTMHSVNEFQRLSDVVTYPTIDDQEMKSGDACFIYEHLRRLCLDRDKLNSILHNTFNKMLTLPQQMKVNPKVAETTFCALIHMIQQFMSISPVPDPNGLKSTLSTIQQFYLWPCPYGSLTRDLLFKLQAESQIPGTLMRIRLMAECTTAEFKLQEANPQTAEEDVWGSAFYYFIDTEDKNSLAFISLSELAGYRPPNWKHKQSEESILLSPTTKALVILNMIYGDLGITEQDIQAMRFLTADQVDQLHRRTGQIIKDITERPEEAQKIRQGGLSEIRNGIQAMARTAQQTNGNQRRDYVRLPELLIPPYLPPLPPPVHLAVQTRVTFEFTTKEQMAFMCLTETPYPSTPHYEQLISILSTYASARNPYPVILRLIIAGGDELLHSFLCAYLLAKQNKSELFDGIAIKFYLLPLSRCHVANFIARHDSWYNRHVYLPVRAPAFLLPWVGSAQSNEYRAEEKPIANIDSTRVGQFLRSGVECYLRESSLAIDFHCYRVECWVYSTAQKSVQSDHVIPAMQRIELGAAPMAAKLKEQKKIQSNLSPEDIAKDKNFDFSPPEITVKFTKMDLSGRVQDTVQDDPAPYHSIVFASVPRKSDLCFPPDPTAPFLEMGARMHKSYQRQTNRKNILAQDPKQHIVEAEIGCSAGGNQQFNILVDGQLFGPYHHIKISPVVDRDGQRVKFPIQTFFPLDI